jgi:hypothetical protein
VEFGIATDVDVVYVSGQQQANVPWIEARGQSRVPPKWIRPRTRPATAPLVNRYKLPSAAKHVHPGAIKRFFSIPDDADLLDATFASAQINPTGF